MLGVWARASSGQGPRGIWAVTSEPPEAGPWRVGMSFGVAWAGMGHRSEEGPSCSEEAAAGGCREDPGTVTWAES